MADADAGVLEQLPESITLSHKTSPLKEGWHVASTEPAADPSDPEPAWREAADGTLELLLVREIGWTITAALTPGPDGTWTGTVTERSDDAQPPRVVGSLRLEPP